MPRADGRTRRHAGTPACALLALVLCACAARAPARGTEPAAAPLTPLEQLASDILAATRMPGVERAAWGIAVESLDRDEPVFSLNPSTLLVPASTAKLVAVASAVDAVGWDYRFETTVRTNGDIRDGVLHGDLVIAGSGDPSISGRGGEDLTPWIDALKALGVRRIDGRVIGDDDAIEEPRPALAWTWDDLGYPTGALFGALNIAENRMTVTVQASPIEGGPTALFVEHTAVHRPLENRTVTGAPGSRLLIWPEQRPGEHALTIAGSVPAGAPATQLSVSAGNPTAWFAHVFRTALLDAGIEVTGGAFDGDDVPAGAAGAPATVLFTYRSPALSQIAHPLLQDSINLYAEALMRLNAAAGGLPTNDAALAGLQERLAAWGIPPDGQQLVDGSGLSRRDVITARTLVAVLTRMHDPASGSPWMMALPIAGRSGSLSGRMQGTPAEGNVRAKTGTMSNVRSLAGYVTTGDGEGLAFAILVNNFEGTGTQAAEAVDAIAVRLASFTRGR